MGNAVSRNYKTKKSIKKLFNNYFEYISTSVLLVNRDGVIIECNNNLVKLLGYEKTLLIGDNISKLIPQHFQNQHQRYLKNFNIDKKQSRLMGKSRSVSIMTFIGNLIPIEITLDIIKIQSTEYILVFISEVVNELNKIENLEYKMFFDVSVEMFCIANTDGYFVKTNEAFTKVLGYTEMELKQVPFLEFVHPNDKQATVETFQYLKDEKYISDFIKIEIESISSGDRIQIIGIEEDFNVKFQSEKFKDEINLKGQIDRIDNFNGKLRIIDYKTGKKIEKKELNLSNWENLEMDYDKIKNWFQLLFYAYAYNMTNNQNLPTEVGIISFKNLKSGLLKFNFGTRFDNKSIISDDILKNYKILLENILTEIMNSNINFVEKKLPKKNYV